MEGDSALYSLDRGVYHIAEGEHSCVVDKYINDMTLGLAPLKKGLCTAFNCQIHSLD